LSGVPKDARTRYQGVYARHRLSCATGSGKRCDCSPSYWGKVWDRASGKPRKTRFLDSPTAARNARNDLEATLRAGMLPASSTMRVVKAIEAFFAAAEAGTALNKHGRRYKSSAIRDLRGALEGHVEPVLGMRRLGDVHRADVQSIVDVLTPEKSGSRVRTVVNAIHSLYAWAQDRELANHDPASRVRLPAMNATPRDRVATVKEIGVLLGALEPADGLPYALAVYATARRGEIRHARVEDVDLDLGVLYLGADDRGRKSRAAQRAVPLNQADRLDAEARADAPRTPGRG
jgi:integrase